MLQTFRLGNYSNLPKIYIYIDIERERERERERYGYWKDSFPGSHFQQHPVLSYALATSDVLLFDQWEERSEEHMAISLVMHIPSEPKFNRCLSIQIPKFHHLFLHHFCWNTVCAVDCQQQLRMNVIMQHLSGPSKED